MNNLSIWFISLSFDAILHHADRILDYFDMGAAVICENESRLLSFRELRKREMKALL
jgi:hypothetical protein